ncbi:MAG: hypothetical protein KIS75_06960 [Chromatiales bacterium]|nr:hypothetical protein [Chromatiales bacterium]
MKRLESDQAELERRLDLREIAMRRQYSALDQLVGSLQSTSAFLFANSRLTVVRSHQLVTRIPSISVARCR